MRRATDFASVVRSGLRARRGCLVVHHRSSVTSGPAIVGFVVGKSVGNSVVRHRVTRRLRAVCADRLTAIPGGSGTVIRALPEAADASSAELGVDLDLALAKLIRVPA
jgi:ribonuclease P protein component